MITLGLAGRGAGSLMGGLMIDKMGTRAAFRIFGFVCMAYALIHAILHYTWLRRLPKPRRSHSIITPSVTLSADQDDKGMTHLSNPNNLWCGNTDWNVPIESKDEVLYVGSSGEELEESLEPVKKPAKGSMLSLIRPMNIESWGSFMHVDSAVQPRSALQVRRRAGTATGVALLPHSIRTEEEETQCRKSRHHSIAGTSPSQQ